MGVSKNGGTPKWMVYNGKPLLKWMIWGYHYFRKHPDPLKPQFPLATSLGSVWYNLCVQASNNKIPPHERCTKFSGRCCRWHGSGSACGCLKQNFLHVLTTSNQNPFSWHHPYVMPCAESAPCHGDQTSPEEVWKWNPHATLAAKHKIHHPKVV